MEDTSSSKPVLTKHLRSNKLQLPFYTGGSLYLSSTSDLIYALCNFTVVVYDSSKCTVQTTIVPENEEILCFGVDPSEKTLVTYSRNQMFRIWDLPDGKCIKHFKSLHSVALELDLQRNLVAAGTSDRNVCVYDYRKGFATHVLKGHKGIITKVSFHPIAERLQIIAASVDNTIRIWDLVLNSCIAVLGYSAPCSAFVFTPDGNSLYSSHRDKHIIQWNLQTKVKSVNLEVDEEVEAMHYFEKHKKTYLALFGDKGVARILDINSKEVVATGNEPMQPFLRCVYVKNGNKLVGVTTEQNLIYYTLDFDANNGDVPVLTYVKDCIGFHDEILDLAYDSINKQLILATNSSLLK